MCASGNGVDEQAPTGGGQGPPIDALHYPSTVAAVLMSATGETEPQRRSGQVDLPLGAPDLSRAHAPTFMPSRELRSPGLDREEFERLAPLCLAD